MMKYRVTLPHFPRNDISGIVNGIRRMLIGSEALTMGPCVRKFESEFARYVGTRYAVATNSCTSALEIALKVVGIKGGDEVIVPAQTFVATGTSVVRSGGKVIFCEIDDNFLMDFEDMKKKITNRTKAVVIVHFAGLIHPDIIDIRSYLTDKGIHLIEDAAHAHGASVNGIRAGKIGKLGCFSFYSSKIMTTGEGGMVTSDSKIASDLCASLRNRGIDTSADSEIFSNIGFNGRMTEFQALLGLFQLRRLEEFVGHRNRIAGIYREELASLREDGLIKFQEYPDTVRHAYWRFLISLKGARKTRERLQDELNASGIRIDWPYEPLLHLQPVFRKIYGIKKGLLKRSERLARRFFCIPIHLRIQEKDAIFIAGKLRKSIR